jgi:hypothetical protein
MGLSSRAEATDYSHVYAGTISLLGWGCCRTLDHNPLRLGGINMPGESQVRRRNLKLKILDGTGVRAAPAVQFAISDFGFEMQDWSNFKFLPPIPLDSSDMLTLWERVPEGWVRAVTPRPPSRLPSPGAFAPPSTRGEGTGLNSSSVRQQPRIKLLREIFLRSRLFLLIQGKEFPRLDSVSLVGQQPLTALPSRCRPYAAQA